MPTLTVRALGVSYLIEGLPESGLDRDALRASLEAAYGPALACLGDEREGCGPDPENLLALILDRKAESLPGLLERLASWVRDRGFSYASWSEDPLADGTRGTLHFHGGRGARD